MAFSAARGNGGDCVADRMETAQTAEQTVEHQFAHARSGGFTIDEVVSDNGVSSLSTRQNAL